jgi:hypothetical protein
MEAMAITVVSRRIKKRWWLFNSDKKRYSLAAKANTQNKNNNIYFAFIIDACLKLLPQYRKFKYKNETI